MNLVRTWYAYLVQLQLLHHEIINTHKKNAVVVMIADEGITYDHYFLKAIVNSTKRIDFLVYLFLCRKSQGRLDITTAAAFVAYEINL